MVNRDGCYTTRCGCINELQVPSHTTYIYSKKLEERSRLVDSILADSDRHVDYVQVETVDEMNDIVKNVSSGCKFSLSAADEIKGILMRPCTENIYLDASGLSVRILGPFLNAALQLSRKDRIRVCVVYAEPLRYKVEKFKEEGEYCDLAEKIRGIYPVASLGQIGSFYDESILVPMLGFEGGRFSHIVANTDFPTKGIYPIIGVSGYRPEYPFVTYCGNRQPLLDEDAWSHVEFAMAGSVVDAFRKLCEIKDSYAASNTCIKIAPIGTKPHAIAALTFACCFPKITEIIYDNPIRKQVRTKGVGTISVTCISDLVNNYYAA